jgi:glycosyltransferase involved in cell wall biosynthesis
MKVAFPMRVDAFAKAGGDLHQAKDYIEAVSLIASEVGSRFCAEIVTDLNCPLSDYDIVHLTNLDRPVETFAYLRKALEFGKPIVFSSIHHSYREISQFEKQGRGGIVGLLTARLDFQQLELVRSFVRSLQRPKLFWPTVQIWRHGVKRAQAEILECARVVLVLGRKEERDIREDFSELAAVRFECLPHGLDKDREGTRLSTETGRDIDVCVVGRIEARKNQIKILDALESLGLFGIFIGKMNPYHRRYCRDFYSRVIHSGSQYLGELSHDQTLGYMRRSKVHVSASWFEVSSLVDLEAFREGCSIVSSKCGCTREVLNGNAEYVSPDDVKSIECAIRNALARNSRAAEISKESSLQMPSRKDVGGQLFHLYRSLLGA